MALYQHCTSVTYFLAGNVRSYAKCAWNKTSEGQDKVDHFQDLLVTRNFMDMNRAFRPAMDRMIYKASFSLTYEEFCEAFIFI